VNAGGKKILGAPKAVLWRHSRKLANLVAHFYAPKSVVKSLFYARKSVVKSIFYAHITVFLWYWVARISVGIDRAASRFFL
jgi:hypothetical protein